jgi:cytochrome P450 family 135
MAATLPPGPAAPTVAQTAEWILRPTALLRRCHARHGEPFTLRLAWMDGPLVLVSDPADVKRLFGGDPDVLRGGASSAVLEPLVGRHSVLLLDGEAHMTERRALLPAFHGAALARVRATMAQLAREEVAGWPARRPIRTLERMQSLTLRIILRALLGLAAGPDRDALEAATSRALAHTNALGRLLAMSVAETGPAQPLWAAFRRDIAALDAALARALERREPGSEPAIIDGLQAMHPSAERLRDQLVTLLAAGHVTTAAALSWACERLARHPAVQARLRVETALGDDAYLDAVVKEALRIRPVLVLAPRKLMAPFAIAGHELPAGVHVAACPYLVHRRADLYGPDPLNFRPERFLGAPAPDHGWIPFGGGVRRCLGAAFATLEMKEVLRAVVAGVALAPAGGHGERMRRRGVTLTPAREGRVLAEPLVC